MPPKAHILLRFAVLVCVMLTAAALLLSWPWGWAPALLAAIMVLMAHFTASIERWAEREQRLPETDIEQRATTLLTAEEKVAFKSTLTIVVSLVAVAVVLAATVLEWQLVGIGALLVFAMLAFLGLPFWLAAVEEEVETEREHLTGEVRSIH